jgi:serine protease Do
MSQVAKVAKLLVFVAPVVVTLGSFSWNLEPAQSKSKPAARQTPARKPPSPVDPRGIYQKALPSVVTVLIGNGHGSGFIVSSDGLIVTNAHVTDGAPKVVTVRFSDGTTAPADVLGFSGNREDLSLIKVNVGRKLPALPLAPNGSVKVGDRVFAIGTPLKEADANTFTQGDVIRIDKANNRVFHTALINHGNSGGPLVDREGRLVGVNTAGYNETPQAVYNSSGEVIGSTIPESGQQQSVNVREVRTFLGEYRQGKISSTPTYRNSSPTETASAEGRKPKPISTDGRPMNGKLEKGDNALNDGSYVDLYYFSAKAGQQVTVEMKSTDLNSNLMLYGLKDDGSAITDKVAENDDAGSGNFNSRITISIPKDGNYALFANSKARGETGNYQLSVTLR